jgi:hypothetical protein
MPSVKSLGWIAWGKDDGIPLAVVGTAPETEDELVSTMMVVGSHGSDIVMVLRGGILVTPGSEVRVATETLVEVLVGVALVMVVGITVVGITVLVGVGAADDVSGGTVLLLLSVGVVVLFNEIMDEVTIDDSVEIVVDVMFPDPGGSVVVVGIPVGGSVLLLVSVAETVEFVTGGSGG